MVLMTPRAPLVTELTVLRAQVLCPCPSTRWPARRPSRPLRWRLRTTTARMTNPCPLLILPLDGEGPGGSSGGGGGNSGGGGGGGGFPNGSGGGGGDDSGWDGGPSKPWKLPKVPPGPGPPSDYDDLASTIGSAWPTAFAPG
eukprot:153754-Heterocapsa_arctica.AAC.1